MGFIGRLAAINVVLAGIRADFSLHLINPKNCKCLMVSAASYRTRRIGSNKKHVFSVYIYMKSCIVDLTNFNYLFALFFL